MNQPANDSTRLAPFPQAAPLDPLCGACHGGGSISDGRDGGDACPECGPYALPHPAPEADEREVDLATSEVRDAVVTWLSEGDELAAGLPDSEAAAMFDRWLARRSQPAPEADEREALDRLRERVEGYGNDNRRDDDLVAVAIGDLRTILARRSQPAPETDEREALRAEAVTSAQRHYPDGPRDTARLLNTNGHRREGYTAGYIAARRSQPAPRTVTADPDRWTAETTCPHGWFRTCLRCMEEGITVEVPRGE